MSEGSTLSRLSIQWSTEARVDLRAIDRQTALDILHCIDRYLTTCNADIKRLKPPMTGFRLRCSDYRIFFKQFGEDGISIREFAIAEMLIGHSETIPIRRLVLVSRSKDENDASPIARVNQRVGYTSAESLPDAFLEFSA